MKKILIVGYGRMGSILTRRLQKYYTLSIVETREGMREKAKRVSDSCYRDITDAPLRNFDLIILSIKPQNLDSFTDLIQEKEELPFLSIMAGISLSKLKTQLKSKSIARLMPSLAASQGLATSALCLPPYTQTSFASLVRHVSSLLGDVWELPEKLFPAMISLSGSGLAFICSFIDAMAMGGTREGIAYEESLSIACSVLHAAAKLCKKEHPAVIASQISSAAGTTIEGLYNLEKGALKATIMHAMHESANKARNFESLK